MVRTNEKLNHPFSSQGLIASKSYPSPVTFQVFLGCLLNIGHMRGNAEVAFVK